MTSSATIPTPSDSPKVEKENPWAVLFFAAFFFLCSADQFFATRVLGYNLRWGQLILLGLAIAALSFRTREARNGVGFWRFQRILILCWLPFFLVYALAALFSETPQATFLKWGWVVFNVGGAILVCLSSRWGPAFKKGFVYAALALAGLIWFQTLAVYWFGLIPGPASDVGTIPLHIPGISMIPFGYMQPSFQHLGITFFRPNAFFYEPSYAGAALSFALPLVMALSFNGTGWKSSLSPALLLSAIFLCSSRTGFFAAAISLVYIFVHALFQRRRKVFFQILWTLLFSVMMVLVFTLSNSGRCFIQFINGPLGTETLQRVKSPQSSEGARIKNIQDCIDLWSRHVALGNGVKLLNPGQAPGLSQISMNTWLEIGVESGVLGFSAFLFAVLASMMEALKRGWKTYLALFVIAAWLAHFSIRYNFSQTIPRLDYWLFFFFSVRLLLLEKSVGSSKSSQ